MGRVVLLGVLLCGSLNSSAQTEILVQTDTVRAPKVMVDVDGTLVGLGGWSRDTLSVKILVDGKEVEPESKKGQRALREATIGASEEAELANIDKMINDMVGVFGTLPAGDSLLQVVQLDQVLWLRARSAYCGDMTTAADQADERKVVGCQHWASICRLEDLLAFYDSLNK